MNEREKTPCDAEDLVRETKVLIVDSGEQLHPSVAPGECEDRWRLSEGHVA